MTKILKCQTIIVLYGNKILRFKKLNEYSEPSEPWSLYTSSKMYRRKINKISLYYFRPLPRDMIGPVYSTSMGKSLQFGLKNSSSSEIF